MRACGRRVTPRGAAVGDVVEVVLARDGLAGGGVLVQQIALLFVVADRLQRSVAIRAAVGVAFQPQRERAEARQHRQHPCVFGDDP